MEGKTKGGVRMTPMPESSVDTSDREQVRELIERTNCWAEKKRIESLEARVRELEAECDADREAVRDLLRRITNAPRDSILLYQHTLERSFPWLKGGA